MKFFSFLDLFSQPPAFKINNNDKYVTIFSLIISITTILCIFGTFIYYISVSFARTNYQILERMENTIVPSTKISENKISFTILTAVGGQFKDPERLFSIEAKLWDMNEIAKKGGFPTIHDIPVTNCTIYKNAPFEEDFDDLLNYWNTSKCLNFKNLETNLYGRYASLSGYFN